MPTGANGSNGLDTRGALLDAFNLIKASKADGLVVYRLDRLVRDLIVQETLLAEVRRLGGEVFSTSAAEAGYLSDDPDDPSHKLIRQVLGAVAEYERSMIALPPPRSEAQGKGRGTPVALPRSASGSRTASLSPMRMSRTRSLAHGSFSKLEFSIREIASMLTDAERRTKQGGTRWHPTTVARVLRRG